MTQFVKCLLVVAGLAILAGCKKGEDDPFISLRSRKARVTGTWVLESGKLSVEAKDSSNAVNTVQYEMDATSYRLTSGSGSGPSPHSLAVIFSKNGAFEMTQLQGKLSSSKADVNFAGSGTWDFEDGTGKGKENRKKENIYIQVSRASVGYSDNVSFFNKGNTGFRYRIKELRNKRMVLVAENELLSTSTKYAYRKITAEYAFVQ